MYPCERLPMIRKAVDAMSAEEREREKSKGVTGHLDTVCGVNGILETLGIADMLGDAKHDLVRGYLNFNLV